VLGSDDKVHLAYEMQCERERASVALTSIETLDHRRKRLVLGTIDAERSRPCHRRRRGRTTFPPGGGLPVLTCNSTRPHRSRSRAEHTSR
jgi:hypothetical protein